MHGYLQHQISVITSIIKHVMILNSVFIWYCVDVNVFSKKIKFGEIYPRTKLK
jgi:hypothetical protein